MACRCGRERSWVRFGPSMVEVCPGCHRLDVRPVVDPRVPSFEEHVKALNEEIRIEEQEGEGEREMRCGVLEAHRVPTGAKLVLQVVGGNDRWLVKGSRLEAFPGDTKKVDSKDAVNLEVTGRTQGFLTVEVDEGKWGELPKGFEVLLRPTTNATLYRNLLKAFLAVKRRFSSYHDLERPDSLPRIPRGKSDADDHGLRPGQAAALHAAIQLPERGVLLVHGPPGTGKTTVIARFLKEAQRRKRTVLVTSHTHVAIDNALRKALKADPGLEHRMVRLGDSGRVAVDMAHVNRRVGEYRPTAEDLEDEAQGKGRAVPLFENLQSKHGIVGMTLDALACALLASDQADEPVEPFDYVIVDEAGMNAFPKIVIAHAVARRLILVGDPLQLPPIVRAWSFRNDETYKRSHFETLQMLRTDLSVLLDEQFRCDDRIYAWSRDAVYGGKVQSRVGAKPHPKRLLGHELKGPVVWVDTSRLTGNRSEQVGTSRGNATHRDVALAIIKDLARHGCALADIGYIAPFRAQAQLMKELLEEQKRSPQLALVTAATVDAFQGSERRAIVFDLTTLHPAKPHEDHRRLNVSLTRAQDLLVIIGPHSFAKAAKENPFYWSLQSWKEAQVIPAPLPAVGP